MAKAGNHLINALLDLLLNYWTKEREAHYYFIFQLFFNELIQTEQFQKYNCEKTSDLLPHNLAMNAKNKYTDNLWNDILKQSSIHKLTYFKNVEPNSILEHIIKQ